MSIFDSFVEQYPVQKTLRFELIPDESTLKTLVSLEGDALRGQFYPEMKSILDDYYKYFIESVLSDFRFKTEDLENAYLLYQKTVKRGAAKKDKDDFDKLKASMRKDVAEAFKSQLESFGLKEYGKLFGKDNLPLHVYLQKKYADGKISAEDLDKKLKVISYFNKFTTFFSVYKTNRDNMFSHEDKSTAIANRIVNENIDKFFFNLSNFSFICNKYTTLGQQIGVFSDKFSVSAFNDVLSQSGIDGYNQKAVGKDSDDVYGKGINQLINEYIQANCLKSRDVPKMVPLFKQILSDRKTTFIEQLQSDKEMLLGVRECYDAVYPALKRIKVLFENQLVEENLNEVFVRVADLSGISNALYSDWSILRNALDVALKDMTKAKQSEYAKVVSLGELNLFAERYVKTFDVGTYTFVPTQNYFLSTDVKSIEEDFSSCDSVLNLNELSPDRTVPSETNPDGGKGYRQLNAIKKLLDDMLNVLHICKPLMLLDDKGKNMTVDGENQDFYMHLSDEYVQIEDLPKVYNAVRNYVTQNTDTVSQKVRQFLDCSSLLTGWGTTYGNNECLLFEVGNDFYFAKMLSKLSNNEVACLEKADGLEFRLNCVAQKPDNKTIPKNFIRSKGDNFAPAVKEYDLPIQDVIDIYDNGLFKTEYSKTNYEVFKSSLTKLIDYFKLGLSRHADYKDFDYHWKPSAEYKNIAEFYADTIGACYKVTKVPVDFDYLKQLSAEKKLMLFQIYNKDFSAFSKGKKNLHTLYWQMLFDNSNLQNIEAGKPVFKINGNAQIYFRDASREMKVTHPKNQPIANKNPLRAKDKSESTFDYDLYKDRRFAQRKWMFHCPITINFRTQDVNEYSFNRKVNDFLENNKDVNVIGIDRGERHLLYYTVINQKGEILEKNSFNVLQSQTETKEGETLQIETDYHTLLDQREKDRDLARKTWGKIEQIKDLKSGYMSTIVYQLTRLMTKYNAIVVLENLNQGFKNSRKKVEKQVYEKFERAFVDKLNYLVFKDRAKDEVGGALHGLQLTPANPDLKTAWQCGFLLYVNPASTSKICPKTGFVNAFTSDDTKYHSVEQSREFLSKFKKISFNAKEDYFEFSFDFNDFSREPLSGRTAWTACTCGKERYSYAVSKKFANVDGATNGNVHCVCTDVTALLKAEFEKRSIAFADGENLVPKICAVNDASFFRELLFALRLTLQLRHTSGGTRDEDDFILSPIKDTEGRFFDSRKAAPTEPNNADANGAYHIALKGLWTLKHIKDGRMDILNKENWLAFRQLGVD